MNQQSTDSWDVVVIDLRLNRFYVVANSQTRALCDEIVREWDFSERPNIVPIVWPSQLSLPDQLLLG